MQWKELKRRDESSMNKKRKYVHNVYVKLYDTRNERIENTVHFIKFLQYASNPLCTNSLFTRSTAEGESVGEEE